MARVYGDSTPFPHDIDYIHMLRDGVECAVRLLSAQHSIRVAEERAEATERAMRGEVAELSALCERVESVTRAQAGAEVMARVAGQIGAAARTIVDGAVRELEARSEAEVSQAAHVVDKAREASVSALEQFLERHTPPETQSCLSLGASPEQNTGHVTLHTPFGVSAVFGVAIGSAHVWARPRKVGDYATHVEVSMPKEAGWLSKRVEMAPVRLERLFISDLTWAEGSGVLRLRRGPGTGPGYEFRVDREGGAPIAVCPVREDGVVEEQHPLVLADADQAVMRSLWQSVVQSAEDLVRERRRLVSGTFNGQPLLELESPRQLADALIGHMAPVVAEISRRSGAPGELVLRRTLGEGRREETYCTHAELLDKILVLPPDLRVVFSSLHLAGPNALSKLPPPLEAPSRPPVRGSAAPPQAGGVPPSAGPGAPASAPTVSAAVISPPVPAEPFAPVEIDVTVDPSRALPSASAPVVVRVP